MTVRETYGKPLLERLHRWVRKNKPQPKNCQECNKDFKKLDLANISQQYKWHILDYEYLCRKCHMTKDGRYKRFIKMASKITLKKN